MAVSACAEPQRIVEHLPTPPDKLKCELVGTRPRIEPEKAIDWSQIRTVETARLAHEQFVKELRTREGIVAGYVLKLEDALFLCFNNMKWRRDYEAGLTAQR